MGTPHRSLIETLPRDQFTITINFPENAIHPGRLFQSVSDLIRALERFDSVLLRSLDLPIQSTFRLHHVGTGSLVTRIITELESLDDEILKQGKIAPIVGHFLVRGKYAFLKGLRNINAIRKMADLEKLLRPLEIYSKIILRALPISGKKLITLSPPVIQRTQLIEVLKEITTSTSRLQDGDSLSFHSHGKRILLNKGFHFSEEDAFQITHEDVIRAVNRLALVIKKPDYLGDSKWEFRYLGRTIRARILDKDWLAKFKRGDILLRPGDALICQLRSKQPAQSLGDSRTLTTDVLTVYDIKRARAVEELVIFPE